jgi:hypothetical protein
MERLKCKIEKQTKKIVSIQAACDKVPNVVPLSGGFVRIVANDMAQQKTLSDEEERKFWRKIGGGGKLYT